ncbi:MAG: hypothetical protein K2Y32_11810 [Candidatus Obscuribacterales bacterium]|nr:hypothetical protein [Candidatus Obscuribacterales bacterium]
MFDKLRSYIEARFSKKAADNTMMVGIFIYIWGIIIGFKGNVVIGFISLLTVISPLIVGAASLFTFGQINLSAILGTWIFTTASGKAVGITFVTIGLAVLAFNFPTIINNWAKSKITIK